MSSEHEANLTQKRPQDTPEIDRHDREAAHRNRLTPRHGLLARLFHAFNTPWTVRTARRMARRPLTTAEILRVQRSDDR